MKKVSVFTVAIVGLFCAFFFGMAFLVSLNDAALRRCEDFIPADGSGDAGISWQGLPGRPGWVCTTASGSRYIGLLPRIQIATEPPRFENARIVVEAGEKRAYVGYTIVAHGEGQYASYADVRAVGSGGRKLKWKHDQQDRNGSDDIIAGTRPIVVEPRSEPGGDAAYFDASDVRVGETVRVTIPFPAGSVVAPFKVIAGE